RRIDRGRSDYDIRHQFRAGVIYELPIGPGKLWLKNGLASRLIGGWTTKTIIDWSSGYPFNVLSGRGTGLPNITNNAGFSGDPVSVGGLTKSGSAVTWFNAAETALFNTPAVGSYGSGRNIFTGPGFFQTDFALHKTFPIKERAHVELRGE